MQPAARFDRIEGGAVLVHRRPWRLPSAAGVPLVLGSLLLAGTALALRWTLLDEQELLVFATSPANVGWLGAPILALVAARARLPLRYVVTVAHGAVSWRATLTRPRSLRMAEILELDAHTDHVRLRLRDGTEARVPLPPPSVATSSFLSVLRQSR